MFVVVDVEAHFRRPARYGELLQVGCVIDQTTRASLTFKQQIFRESDLLIDGKVRVWMQRHSVRSQCRIQWLKRCRPGDHVSWAAGFFWE
jgi:YbgC/YbaW family acyl-CoA thioester hydrolase